VFLPCNITWFCRVSNSPRQRIRTLVVIISLVTLRNTTPPTTTRSIAPWYEVNCNTFIFIQMGRLHYWKDTLLNYAKRQLRWRWIAIRNAFSDTITPRPIDCDCTRCVILTLKGFQATACVHARQRPDAFGVPRFC
jgi:hypothetical protein